MSRVTSNICGSLDVRSLDIDGQKFTVRTYLFRTQTKDEKNPAENYRKDEGVIFTYNGQAQAVYTKDFFRRKRVKQDYLWNSLLVFVECTAIGVRAHEQLFMANREHLRHGPLKRRLERELEDKLHQHKELEQIAIARRKGELSECPDVSETFEKFVEDMVKKHPLLEQILGPGFRIATPSGRTWWSRSRSRSRASASPPNSTSAAGRRARHSTATHI